MKATGVDRGVQEALRELRAAGYALVEPEPRWARDKGASVDLIAWGPREDGDFGPLVAVEVKSKSDDGSVQRGLAALGAIATVLGTERNLLHIGGQWLEADRGFTRATPIAGPPRAHGMIGSITDEDVLARLLTSRLWASDRFRHGRSDAALPELYAMLDEVALQGRQVVGPLPGMVSDPLTFVESWLEVAGQSGGRFAGEYATMRAVNEAMAALTGDIPNDSTVLDPFAGIGGSLLSAYRKISAAGLNADLRGVEVNAFTADVADRLLRLVSPSAVVEAGDSLRSPLPAAETVVAVPPFGLRLSEPVDTPIGQTTDGDVAVLATSVAALKPAGRAVLLTSRGWSGRSGVSQRLRAWLSSEKHVVALIGLPPVSQATGIPLMLTVIDNAQPGETLVADLASDWADQLTPGSELVHQLAPRADR